VDSYIFGGFVAVVVGGVVFVGSGVVVAVVGDVVAVVVGGVVVVVVGGGIDNDNVNVEFCKAYSNRLVVFLVIAFLFYIII
jgi:hypothetical protein